MVKFLVLIFSLLATVVSGQTIVPLDSGHCKSIRGLSVPDDKTIWVSGTGGTVGLSVNGGKNWNWTSLKGYEQCDFRSIEAFNSKIAIIANAGSPGFILRTTDGGKNWKEVYRNSDSLFFIDGISFWDKRRGIVFGDPMNGRMLMMTTEDSGKTWKNLPEKSCPKLDYGEAAFAASGTTIRTQPGGKLWIATGGKKSRLWYSFFYGLSIASVDCPIVQGKSSTGIFSFAVISPKNIVITGGDYLLEQDTTANAFYTKDGGKHWKRCSPCPGGYRSVVEYTGKRTCIAAGTSGVDISNDGGESWKNISKQSFHTARRSKKGKLIVLAGAGGKVATVR